MGKAIGIDLGTTNTAVAVLVDGRPRVLEDEKGYKVLPSCVSVKASKSGELQFIVGQAAKNLIVTKPDRTVYAVKRLMGRRFDSPEVQQIKRLVSFPIAAAEDGTCKLKMGDVWYTPVEISALILDVAKTTAERTLGEPVDEAVITVPAYFNHAQRAATFEAAKKAGLRCERLLNEPTAAALAYGHRRDIERTIVVYDLGGGTFDVSVLRLSHGVYEVLSTSGETHLGGEDFDQRVVEHLVDQFSSDTGVDLRADSGALQRVKDAGERAKCELSFTDRTSVLIPRITMADNLEATLTRLALEGLVEDLIQNTLEITKSAVRDAGLRINQVDEVILVGGQTRMPRVREAIGSLFQKEPSRTVHPEEVVAIGAAVHANSLTERAPAGAPHAVLLDVTPFDLGIDVVGGKFEPIIKRNSQVPTQATKTFYTNKDGQESVKVTVRQGEHSASSDNEFLGEFVMTGLTPAARMSTKVEVTFKLDMNGMLHVSALEPGSGEKKRITIRNYAEYARSSGRVGVDVEGDVQQAVEAPVEPVKKDGLLSRLFGGGKKKPAAPPVKPSPAAEAAIPEAPSFLADLEREDRTAPAAAQRGAVPELELAGAGFSDDMEIGGALDMGALGLSDVGGLEAPADLGFADLEELSGDALDGVSVFEDDELEAVVGDDSPWADGPAGEEVEGFAFPEDEEEDEDEGADERADEGADEGAAAQTAAPPGIGAPAALGPPPSDALGELDSVGFGLLDDVPGPSAGGAKLAQRLGAEPTLDPFADLGDPFADEPQLHDPFSAASPGDLDGDAAFGDPFSGSGALDDEDLAGDEAPEAFDIDELDALDAPLGEASTLPLAPAAATGGDADVEDFLASLSGDDDLADMLAGLEGEGELEPLAEAETPTAPAGPAPFKPFLAPSGARPSDRTDIFDRADRSISDFEDEDSDIALVVSRTGEQRAPGLELEGWPSPGAPEEPRLPVGPISLGDITYDDLPDDDFVQFAGVRTGGRAEPELGLPAAQSSVGAFHFDDEDAAGDLRLSDDREDVDDEATDPGPSRTGVARLKVEYRRVDAMVKEYRDNLAKNGCFIKTNRPLKVGRACEIEVRAPGLRRPLQLRGVVSWSSAGLSRLPVGQDAGMGIEYQLNHAERAAIDTLLGRLNG